MSSLHGEFPAGRPETLVVGIAGYFADDADRRRFGEEWRDLLADMTDAGEPELRRWREALSIARGMLFMPGTAGYRIACARVLLRVLPFLLGALALGGFITAPTSPLLRLGLVVLAPFLIFSGVMLATAFGRGLLAAVTWWRDRR